ncbi:MAG: trigger factor family protein [Bacteroidales bacterium]|nr:trigger factor family protein [Bacteroidales bacterium]
MEIKKNEIDGQNFQLTVSVVAEDYAEKRKKMLNDYRRKAELKGFRKGMAPMSIIEKIYGHAATADSVNGVVSESLQNYIKDNALNIIGEPLPAEEQPENDWEAVGNFEFAFDVALYPQIDFELGKDDHIVYYTITPSDEAVEDMKNSILRQYGHFKEGEEQKLENFVPAEPNQETFDKIFGPDKIHSEEEFTAKMGERLVVEYGQEAEYKFGVDARKYLIDKAAVELPSAFLKRWLVAANEGKYTVEDVEKEFDGFLEDFKWQCVRDYLMRKFEVKVDRDDLLAEAKSFAAYQFAMYGMYDVPNENIEQFAYRIMSDERDSRRVAEAVEQRKVLAVVKEQVSVDEKTVTLDEFRELTAPPKKAEEGENAETKE